MGDVSEHDPDDRVRHDAIRDGCNKTIFGIRRECQICPDWNKCNLCIAQARRKHVFHRFAAICDPQKVRDTPTFRSQALNFGRLEARFLTLFATPFSPGSSTEVMTSVSCELSIRPLHECPEYTALSYSWGDHGSTRPILLDGRVTQVKASLEVALKELVSRGVRTIWVDGLCIDQENDYEKVYQLRQMGTIFSRAAKVVAWLGPAEKNSDNAMQALTSISEAYDPNLIENRADDDRNLIESLQTLWGNDGVDRHGHAILQLLKRQYWERVWIIQELAKASNIEIWCGTQMLVWNTFIKGVQAWWSTTKIHVEDFDHPIFTLKHFCEAENKSRRGATRMLLSDAMVRTLHTKATLRRDRAYALLGVTRDGTETVPTPNYVQTDGEVFSSILRHMIVEQGQLDLIFLARLGSKTRSSPSWLPSWDNDSPLGAAPWIIECFQDNEGGDHAVDCQENVLKVKGRILGRLVPKDVICDPKCALIYLKHLESLLARHLPIFRCSNQMRVDQYSNFPWYAAYLSALLCSPADKDRARCPKLRRWFERNIELSHVKGTCINNLASYIGHRNVTNFNASFRVRDRGDLSASWPWPEQFEAWFALLLHHGVDVLQFKSNGQHQLILGPQRAQANDVIAQIVSCSLPVVLRRDGGSRYSVVGEVAEKPSRDASLKSLWNSSSFEATATTEPTAWSTLHLV